MAAIKIRNVRVIRRSKGRVRISSVASDALRDGSSDLADFFSSLTENDTAERLVRAIRRRNRREVREILNRFCSIRFFSTPRYRCVKICCFYGRFRAIRICFEICVRRFVPLRKKRR